MSVPLVTTDVLHVYIVLEACNLNPYAVSLRLFACSWLATKRSVRRPSLPTHVAALYSVMWVCDPCVYSHRIIALM